ncbi:MAG: hypothetical protein LBP57_05700 [Endomicrobium sp.]|jgi:hypothetical protein|nr:hypothetical protein [Endomicrobium sp.]
MDLKVPVFVDIDVMMQLHDIKNFIKKVNPYGFDSDFLIERAPKTKDYDNMSFFIKTCHGF